VPSKKLWFDAQDRTPPIAGFWRNEGTTKDFPGLVAVAQKVKLYSAPKTLGAPPLWCAPGRDGAWGLGL